MDTGPERVGSLLEVTQQGSAVDWGSWASLNEAQTQFPICWMAGRKWVRGPLPACPQGAALGIGDMCSPGALGTAPACLWASVSPCVQRGYKVQAGAGPPTWAKFPWVWRVSLSPWWPWLDPCSQDRPLGGYHRHYLRSESPATLPTLHPSGAERAQPGNLGAVRTWALSRTNPSLGFYICPAQAEWESPIQDNRCLGAALCWERAWSFPSPGLYRSPISVALDLPYSKVPKHLLMTCGCLLVVTTGRACGSVHRLETQLSTALDPGDTARINHTGDPSLRGLLGRLGTQEMSDKELLFVGTSWRGWGKLRFELS